MKKIGKKSKKNKNHELNKYFVKKMAFYQKHKGNGEILHHF